MISSARLVNLLPTKMQNQVEAYLEALEIFMEIRDPRVLRALGPAGIRGLILKRGKQGTPTKMPASHSAHFDWTYPADQPEMAELYRRAKQGQWDSDVHLNWKTSVDPLNPEVPLLPASFVNFDALKGIGIHLSKTEEQKFLYSITSWMLSQFLHGEQGALFAAAQVTEAVQFFDGKLYGATQVMDEGRHVEVFHRYLDQKLNKLYQVNDNLFVIIDSLMSDGRWDMKFLGMQIMVEGLALAAFGFQHQITTEPLLKKLLRYVMSDEARHVAFGVLSLKEVYEGMSDSEMKVRQEFAFEAAVRMRDRFLSQEVWDRMGVRPRDVIPVILADPGRDLFQQMLFSKIVPNCKKLGLLDRNDKWLRHRFEEMNVIQFEDWADTTEEMEALALGAEA